MSFDGFDYLQGGSTNETQPDLDSEQVADSLDEFRTFEFEQSGNERASSAPGSGRGYIDLGFSPEPAKTPPQTQFEDAKNPEDFTNARQSDGKLLDGLSIASVAAGTGLVTAALLGKMPYLAPIGVYNIGLGTYHILKRDDDK